MAHYISDSKDSSCRKYNWKIFYTYQLFYRLKKKDASFSAFDFFFLGLQPHGLVEVVPAHGREMEQIIL